MSYRTFDGRATWNPRITGRAWECDCTHENPHHSHKCRACGLLDTDRECEQ